MRNISKELMKISPESIKELSQKISRERWISAGVGFSFGAGLVLLAATAADIALVMSPSGLAAFVAGVFFSVALLTGGIAFLLLSQKNK